MDCFCLFLIIYFLVRKKEIHFPEGFERVAGFQLSASIRFLVVWPVNQEL